MICLASADINLVQKLLHSVLSTNIHFFAKRYVGFFGLFRCSVRFFGLYFLNTTISFIFVTIKFRETTYSHFEIWLFRELIFKKSKFSSDRKICTFSFLVFLLYQLHSTTQYHKQPNRENDFWWNAFYFLAAPQKNCMRHDSSCNYYFWFLFGNPLQENSWGLPTFLVCVVSSKNLKKFFYRAFFSINNISSTVYRSAISRSL